MSSALAWSGQRALRDKTNLLVLFEPSGKTEWSKQMLNEFSLSSKIGKILKMKFLKQGDSKK